MVARNIVDLLTNDSITGERATGQLLSSVVFFQPNTASRSMVAIEEGVHFE
jgi:hypothetical protein